MEPLSKEHSECEDEINLYDYWKVIVKRKKLIIGIFLISVISAVVISLLMPKVPTVYEGVYVFKIPARKVTTEPSASGFTIKELLGIVGKTDGKSLENILPKTHHLATDIKLLALADSTDKIQLFICAYTANDIASIASEFSEYLKNFPLIKSYLEQEKEILSERSEELSSLIEDSEKIVMNYERLFKNGSLTVVGINPIEVNKSMSELRKEKIMIDKDIRDLKGVEILGQPYISSKPVDKSKTTMIVALTAVCSLFAGLLLALFMDNMDKRKG